MVNSCELPFLNQSHFQMMIQNLMIISVTVIHYPKFTDSPNVWMKQIDSNPFQISVRFITNISVLGVAAPLAALAKPPDV